MVSYQVLARYDPSLLDSTHTSSLYSSFPHVLRGIHVFWREPRGPWTRNTCRWNHSQSGQWSTGILVKVHIYKLLPRFSYQKPRFLVTSPDARPDEMARVNIRWLLYNTQEKAACFARFLKISSASTLQTIFYLSAWVSSAYTAQISSAHLRQVYKHVPSNPLHSMHS